MKPGRGRRYKVATPAPRGATPCLPKGRGGALALPLAFSGCDPALRLRSQQVDTTPSLPKGRGGAL
eukprot:12495235-Alexandrium_andersonii.AAC.1